MALIIPITIEPQIYPQNPSILKSLIIKSVIQRNPAFNRTLKIPKVIKLNGSATILKTGLMIKLIKPRSKPAIKAILNLPQIVSVEI